ncbi:hypothetical protein HI914_00084 [Erysiphe necator]|nr:hypothetical protein HI914_00084 [Erysiphe necator]
MNIQVEGKYGNLFNIHREKLVMNLLFGPHRQSKLLLLEYQKLLEQYIIVLIIGRLTASQNHFSVRQVFIYSVKRANLDP